MNALRETLLFAVRLAWHLARETWRFCRSYRERYPKPLSGDEVRELEAMAEAANAASASRWHRVAGQRVYGRAIDMHDIDNEPAF
jgi:hypothetical protein